MELFTEAAGLKLDEQIALVRARLSCGLPYLLVFDNCEEPIERYVEELRSPRLFDRLPLLQRDGMVPTGHERDVARTFALSYEQLDPQDTEDAVALRLLAHLAPGERIPTRLLMVTFRELCYCTILR